MTRLTTLSLMSTLAALTVAVIVVNVKFDREGDDDPKVSVTESDDDEQP